ncbi:flagellar brake protein [Paraburkholderia sp. BCC1886]|uniref:flagellar brake protein n=1 Tax=Paraburkholderia sp. BCC1886 TaxID=2562670 RepID=UPI001181F2FD|nr:flagellar brake protein [Paraburkholderia sp. BCC1886]
MENAIDESVAGPTPAAAATVPQPSPALTSDVVPVGTPLEWPIVDADGTPLFASGATVATADERAFLFKHFRPYRGDLLDADEQATAKSEPSPDSTTPLTIKDMHLEIGSLIGVRSQLGSGAPMHPCRIIGFAPNHALFVTPPLHQGRMLDLRLNENIEIVAIASQAVFRFVCTVESVCRAPFDYVVLSKPGVIRRLRERKSIRVHSHLAVRFSVDTNGESYEGLGLAKGISALGMSLTTTEPLGAVGTRVRVAFRLKSADMDSDVETTAIIRNVQKGGAAGESTTHGLELDQLDPNQQIAMKVYVFDRQDDVSYWSNGLR